MLDDDGSVNLDFEDEIIDGACVTRDGEIVHEASEEDRGGRSRLMIPFAVSMLVQNLSVLVLAGFSATS